MVNLIDRDLSIFIYPYCAVDRLSNKIKSTWLANFVSLHRICRTDKAFLFWSDGTIKFDTHIKHCLQLLLITLHKFAENIKV